VGQGKPKDPEMAFTLYSKAAAKGYDAAQFHLGNCFSRGVGTAEDQTKAFEWFKKAADQGHASSLYNVALRSALALPRLICPPLSLVVVYW